MSHQTAVRAFYSTIAVAAVAVFCLAAFTPAGPQAAKAPMTPQAAVLAAPMAAVRADAPKTVVEVNQADLELVGMSIANYDR